MMSPDLFSLSLAVKDIAASKNFTKPLGLKWCLVTKSELAGVSGALNDMEWVVG